MSSIPALAPARERTLLIILMLVQFTAIVDFMVLMPLSSYLMQEMKIGTAQFGLLVSAYSVAAGVSALLAASLADRFDRRHALLVLFAGLVLATLGCALATDFHTLFLARAVAGVFGGVLGSVTFAIVGDVIPPERRGRAMGMVMLGFSLAAVAGVPAGLFIAAHYGWRAPFGVLAVVCAAVWMIAVSIVPPVRGHLGGPAVGFVQGYRELLAERNHWWSFAVSALVMFAGFLVIPYIAPSMVANGGMDVAHLSWVYLCGGAATLISRPWIGALTDRHRHADVLTWITLASFVPILLVTHTPAWPLAGQLVISTLFFVFVSGRFIPASALATGATVPRLRGRLMAATAAMQNLASGLAAFIAGAMMSTGPRGELLDFPWVGYLSCFTGLLALWFARRVKAVG